jgi:DNA-binding beta-propeller fold protein YncE
VRGNAGSPSDGHTVQALRNTRRVEEIAHGRQSVFNFFKQRFLAQRREGIMPLRSIGVIEIPAAAGSSFDHGAFDPKGRRVFVAHTGRDCVEVIDHDAGRHIATLPGFPEAAGVVADDGHVLVTNRGAASLAWVDAQTLERRATFKTGARPNGVAIVAPQGLAVAACIGDETDGARLEALRLDGSERYSLDLPGRPRWCVTDAAGGRLFLAIREPSMVLVARLPELDAVEHWPLPSGGAHGLDIDHQHGRLYVACDDGALVEVDIGAGKVSNQWPIAGVPDATFYNPASGLAHVAIGKPGLVQSINPRTGDSIQTVTAAGAHTTAFAGPDRLYVFSPAHRGTLVLTDA